MVKPWLENLNDQQRQAVVHGDGPLLVIAGAGTGKTMTLACRVAELIGKGVPPERILLLTFTRRAAAEMIRRASNMSGSSSAGKVWGGTFHAMANRLLRIYGEAMGLSPEFTIMDQSDAGDLMNLIRSELGVAKGKRRFPRKETLVSIYSRTVAAQEQLGKVLNERFPWCEGEFEGIREIFQHYTTRKRAQNVLDYDDLLLYWHALATTDGVGQAMAERFEHILVDEYQDTNAMQSEVLRALRVRNSNITVVGDDAQSIYSFRAATIRNILDFPKQYPDTTVVKLEQNYRSTQPILSASNEVMKQARERFTKDLWSKRESDQKPVLIHCWEESDQCTSVCERILGHLEQGIPLMKQAVLFRAGHHSDQLEVELARRNIPFHKYGGLKFVESAHIKDMLAFLRVLENPTDEISWFRILLMLEGVGPKSARRIMDELLAGGDGERGSPLRKLAECPPKVPPAAKKDFTAFCEMVGQCIGPDGGGSSLPVGGQVDRIRRFYEPIFERNYDNSTIRIRDIEQLEQIAAGYDSREKFLADLTLDPPASTSDFAQPPHLDEDYLILSTIHSAKGCEWDAVHVIHAADGMIPSDMAVGDEAGVDEERRLFYVALTRAKDFLYVYFPLRYYHTRYGLGDGHSYAQLSRYMTNAVQSHFEQKTVENSVSADTRVTARGDISKVDQKLSELWQ